jgi:hypothetical protein
MKISLFNLSAPKLIKKYNSVLDKLLNGDTKDIDLNSLKADLSKVNDAITGVTAHLNSVSIAQLKALRTNAKAGSEYGSAVDNAASLSNLIPVLMNMVNEMEPEAKEEEESIDDILESADKDDADENCGKSNADEESEDEDEEEDDSDVDSMLNFASKNGGPSDIDTGAVDGKQDSPDGSEAAVTEGDDVTNLDNLLNFSKVAKPKTKASSTNSNSGSTNIVPDNFLA